MTRFLSGVAIALTYGAALAAPAKPAQLTLRPGMQVVTAIYNGHSQNGNLLGDYDSIVVITQVAKGGYSYQYHSTGAASGFPGAQTVYPDDNKRGFMLREYWPAGDVSRKGDVSYLRLSDQTYADIKAGKDARLEMDDASNPVSVRRIGEEDLTVLVNEKPTKFHTLKVRGKAKGVFWIWDNPAWPMMVRGETTWKWMTTSITDTGAGAEVVDALKSSGQATTHAVLFAFNSADLDPGAKPVLDDVARWLKGNPRVRLEIQGHTDNFGGAAPNLTLSQKRAEAVRAYLVAGGVDGGRLTAKGFGLTVPVADNQTPEGRARNRRVVFSAKG
jgi:outer membrane protein OmpA-like peptidoglycan-associated protein